MNGDDIILSNAVHELCKIFSYRKAELICSVQYLEENVEGNLGVGNIANRKFLRRVDDRFKTLNAPITFQSNDLYQKLMLTGTRAFNSLLGTKFFRRDFLKRNSILFNESLADFELSFVVNAIMASKEIIFAPFIFYVAPKP